MIGTGTMRRWRQRIIQSHRAMSRKLTEAAHKAKCKEPDCARCKKETH